MTQAIYVQWSDEGQHIRKWSREPFEGAETFAHQSGRTGAGEPGWIVGNSDGTKWRVWDALGPKWTADRDRATRYARRVDAEQVHAEDEGAWRVVPYATLSQSTAGEDGLQAAYDAAVAFIESHVADPDITDEMTRMYAEYQRTRSALGSRP